MFMKLKVYSVYCVPEGAVPGGWVKATVPSLKDVYGGSIKESQLYFLLSYEGKEQELCRRLPTLSADEVEKSMVVFNPFGWWGLARLRCVYHTRAVRACTDAEALNPSRCDLVERLTSSVQASVPEVFGSDTFTDSGGVGAHHVYHGSCQLACDMLVGSRHSRSCSHEDYPLQAPSVIIVAWGRKIVWVAPGSFSQLLCSPACSMRQGKLLLDSMYNITPSSLEDLVKEFGGAIYELGPGDGTVVPPGCVHAAYNTEPCLSINVNWMFCSQDQWAACLTATSLTCLQTRKYGFRALARERLPQGSDTDIEALAADLEQKVKSVAGSTDSVLGCHHFDRGFTSWIGDRLASHMSIVAAQKVWGRGLGWGA
ncbi:hypothetical protein VOLCADRAFT_97814 [Volvox carteri f. nagariensis]|uniref:JmjC domain-containing protein n=1 Tax=Volvox carteri f. nagariensis TaxID=3068 RepID=D8UDP8_VOLCA|nr:uncharacterized protein VOLCADRAFT_97814 [Volvox carteri f. nagariensis]EFJ42080.1 hypothetical protein VOLCADRAFT_97814 [Volvox carteri f. nagariensis]|eukprot:XP_002956777.1 hypothetical protein VOLCADRAFT_97814 [Volvox carteri f. nagariensis]